MIEFLKTWTNQIIVAVIIATIIEMLLPNGSSKKYIKMVIGIYVLFTIIQPIIVRATGESFDISNLNYEKYFDKNILETSTKDFEDNNSKLIKQAYIDNIKSDIETKIKQKGYEVSILGIDIIEDEKLDTYGSIKNISLKIKKIQEENKKEVRNTIEIENVDINISERSNNNNINNTEKSSISDKEKKDLIKYLTNEYSISKENIIIN